MPELTQKVCPRCRSIYAGKAAEVVCPTCQDAIKRATARKDKAHHQTAPPANPVLQCLIKREGPTSTTIGGAVYTFTPNDRGHATCRVTNPNHNKFLIRSGQYAPYCAEP
ncbi:MAG: hypothetical protein PHN92_02085 [Geobacter sp.]|nr:hypothetical protein [Geobacter sp.]